MENTDIRWLQRYANFHRACERLAEVTDDNMVFDDFTELELEGVVQRFEYTFELAWKVLQDLLVYKGYDFMKGPNGTIKAAFEDGLLTDHDGWRAMAQSRNVLSHVYDEAEVLPVIRRIFNEFSPLLSRLDATLGLLSNNPDYRQR